MAFSNRAETKLSYRSQPRFEQTSQLARQPYLHPNTLLSLDTPRSCYNLLPEGQKYTRMLRLLPALGPTDTEICCLLSVIDLENAYDTFEALSYTWGQEDSFGLSIQINNTSMPVRKNLHDILSVLRVGILKERIIWVDALCINQADVAERGNQVAMMGEIYRSAKCVIVWLGEMNTATGINPGMKPQEQTVAKPSKSSIIKLWKDSIQKALQVPKTYRQPVTAHTLLRWMGAGDITYQMRQEMYNSEEFHIAWKQLNALCCFSQYWTRLWIVQELGLAREAKLYFDGQIYDWRLFFPLAAFIDNILKDYISDFSEVSIYIGLREIMEAIRSSLLVKLRKQDYWWYSKHPRRATSWPLENLIRDTVLLRCQDRRDKIYGLLGLATDLQLGEIPVDYSISHSALYYQMLKWKVERIQLSHGASVPLLKDGSLCCVSGFSSILQRALTLSSIDTETSTAIPDPFSFDYTLTPLTRGLPLSLALIGSRRLDLFRDEIDIEFRCWKSHNLMANYLGGLFDDGVKIEKAWEVRYYGKEKLQRNRVAGDARCNWGWAKKYTSTGYNVLGYNSDGFDRAGYDSRGLDCYGYDSAGYNVCGYNAYGFKSSGYDLAGFNCHGYNAEGYDRSGYDSAGRNSNGRYDANFRERHARQMPLSRRKRNIVRRPDIVISKRTFMIFAWNDRPEALALALNYLRRDDMLCICSNGTRLVLVSAEKKYPREIVRKEIDPPRKKGMFRLVQVEET